MATPALMDGRCVSTGSLLYQEPAALWDHPAKVGLGPGDR